MEEVKRYTIDFSDGETAEGVLYTDYAALKARVAELDHDRIIREAYEAEFGKLDELRERIAKTTDAQHLAQLVTNKARDYAKDERDSLRAQLEAANERHFQAVYAVGEEIEKNEALQAQLTAQPDGVRHQDGGTLRPSVVRFARLMESQLRKNDSRGGWSNCDRVYFMEKLEINLRDLHHDLRAGAKDAVQRDCADLGNFAMMLAENEFLAAQAQALAAPASTKED